jgi:hypothetical protein
VTWPGKDADDWWDSLSPDRKEAYHRWLTQRRPHDDLPAQQLDLTALIKEEHAMALTPGEHAGTKNGRRDDVPREEDDELDRKKQNGRDGVEAASAPESKAWPPRGIEHK